MIPEPTFTLIFAAFVVGLLGGFMMGGAWVAGRNKATKEKDDE